MSVTCYQLFQKQQGDHPTQKLQRAHRTQKLERGHQTQKLPRNRHPHKLQNHHTQKLQQKENQQLLEQIIKETIISGNLELYTMPLSVLCVWIQRSSNIQN